ncbi:MAG TPA: hypothetical protein VGZ01_05515 [Trinickia sp.]|nr:hypothetical protein [Trinickia sp.]
MMRKATWRLSGQFDGGPSGVDAQSNSRISRPNSLSSERKIDAQPPLEVLDASPIWEALWFW